MTIRESVIWQGIESDSVYAGRFITDLSNPKCASFGPIVMFCMAPYFSLFVHESNQKLCRSDQGLASLLSTDVKAIVERSRHTLKLFEDNHRWIEGQLEYFRDEIIPAHTNYFVSKLPFPAARAFMKDLGIYSYDKKVYANTHGATFHIGIEPDVWFTMAPQEQRAIYEQYGRYFHRLGARLDSGASTFLVSLTPELFNQEVDDVLADEYYASVFDGHHNCYLNAVLTVFRGMMNFVNSVIISGARSNDIDYTVFKIRFLTLYAILGSLKRLHAEHQSHNLTARSVSFIGRIINTAETQVITEPSAKPFRNTLMHYLDPRVDLSRVDFTEPLFGLVPVYFPSYDVPTFAAMIDQCIGETASVIEEWAVL